MTVNTSEADSGFPVARCTATLPLEGLGLDGEFPVMFHSVGSGDPDGGAITDYHWDFGELEPENGFDLQDAPHVYRRAGDFIARLTVTDNELNKSSDECVIRVF